MRLYQHDRIVDPIFASYVLTKEQGALTNDI